MAKGRAEQVDYVDYDTEGNPTLVMKDGSRRTPPPGWSNAIPGDDGKPLFSATKLDPSER